MLTFGTIVSWGQAPAPVDYSGTYYIASVGYDFNPNNTNNYYLCPTEGWAYYVSEGNPYCTVQGDPNEKPFLTTYQIKKNSYDVTKAKWTLTKIGNSDNYYIHQTGTSNYIVTNGAVSSNPDRARVHLETISDPNDLDEKAQFAVYPYNGHMVIKSISINETQDDVPSGSAHVGTHADHKWFTVNQGNKPDLKGTDAKKDGPSSFKYTGGIVGIYTENDANSPFYLEDVITRPTITINSSKLIEITPAQSGDVTIKYTTDGSAPSASNGTDYTGAFELGDNVTIKAVAIVSGEVSNIATFQRRLIQNQGNGWNDNTNFHFYMTQGDDESSITKVNTTSLFRPSMEWYIIDAKNGFNYIVNASNNKYLCYDGTNVSLTTYNDTNDNQYKFGIRESPTAGTFNICPYLANILFKASNENATVLSAFVYSNDHFNSGGARWKFILPSDLDTTPPFVVSTTTSTNYYHIENVGNSGYFIVPPTGTATAVATTNQDAQEKNGRWYFVVAQEPSATDWCTYYHIRNAVTGEYLYFIKDTNNDGDCLEMRNTIVAGNEERYLFTWARTATENTYYIIPKMLKDVSLNCFSALRKHDSNTSILTNVTRDASRFGWKFTDAELFCNNPVFDATGEKVIISCNTNASEIFYTEDGGNPDSESTKYTSSSDLTTSESRLIKAIAICGTAQSEIVTLINKPNITLSQETYTYDGTEKTPEVAQVSIGETIIPSTEYTSDGVSPTYTNNMNAGTETVKPTVTLTDVVDNNLFLANASRTFTINPIQVTLTWTDTELEYNGLEQKPTLTVGNIVEGETLTITVSIVEDGGGINMGTYTATATIEPNSNYVLPTDVPLTTSYTITSKMLGDGTDPASDISIDITYDGSDYNIIVKQGNTTLNAGETNDYTQTGSASANGKYYIVTVTGSGNNYGGSFTAKYALMKFDHQATSGEFSGTFVSDAGNGETEGDGDFAVPDGMKAYIITDIRVALDQVVAIEVGYIPEGVPVLLLYSGDAEANPASGFLVKEKSDGTAAVNTDNNLLKVTTAPTSFSTGKIYLLYKGEFVLNKAGNLAAGKIYLDNTTGSVHAPRLAIAWDESTGVEDVRCKMEEGRNDKWYTLDGRRLSGKPTKKGLYIRNGEKRVVR